MMFLRQSLARLALAATMAMVAIPAAAFDPAAMSDAERTAFRAEIRAYLLDNPEVVMEAVNLLEQRRFEAQMAEQNELIQLYSEQILNDPTSWVGGNPDGDITIVEFLDYNCTYCRRAFPEVGELVERDGNIRFVIKEYPVLGEGSVQAARLTLAIRALAGDDAYKATHDALMALDRPFDDAMVDQQAEAAGLDPSAVRAQMQAPGTDLILAANMELGSNLRIGGTPSFIIGEQFVGGYVPLAAMQDIVTQERGD